MQAPTILLEGIAFDESPRWYDGRLWFANWGARQEGTTRSSPRPNRSTGPDPLRTRGRGGQRARHPVAVLARRRAVGQCAHLPQIEPDDAVGPGIAGS